MRSYESVKLLAKNLEAYKWCFDFLFSTLIAPSTELLEKLMIISVPFFNIQISHIINVL